MMGAQRHGQPSSMVHQFSQVPKADIPRSSFDRSHGHKTAFDAGLLIPIFLDEALPGDTFKVSMTALARLATPIFPVMDNLFMDVHFFAVPNRLVWNNWQRFNGEQPDPGDTTDFTIPQMVSPATTGYAIGSLSDYMGIPTGVPGLTHSALWHRSYHLVWNEWYRDQNLQDAKLVPKGDGPDLPADYALLRRGKRHDYFTGALPWPQKGPAVEIPLGTTAPIIGTNSPLILRTAASAGTAINIVQSAGNATLNGSTSPGFNPAWLYPGDLTLQADLSAASSATINSLRQAFQVQKMFERDARGGTRYTEIVRSHFGVTSPDARLQRPEYLGGGTVAVNISPIPQTSPTGTYASTPQGNLAAIGTAVGGAGFAHSFTEHCLILGLISVRADYTYQQGLNRMWSRKSRFDFYWPALSHIGEQAIMRKELYATGSPANDDIVFGYQERFAEYRYKPSIITGIMRSSAPQSLDAWHLAQDFATAPVLDAAFIEENPPVDRVIAVPSEPHFIFDSFFRMKCSRPMPVYGVPGLIDHF
ncbi:MAG: major capsid protein [Arizlama microvirus]|nr:MAG: major capsid protein [Arizlama microvirus]